MAGQATPWAYSIRPSNTKRKILAGLVLSGMLALAGTTQALGTQPDPEHKVTICHRTGSDTNPYVEITIDEAALDTHLHSGSGHPPTTNPDGSPRDDIYPVPEGGCQQVGPDPSLSDT